ncbi:hypothetical protein FJR45_08800 [Sulfurimonas sediminis]|uniref:Tubulin/FtsZ 2-layer sandwich domain-containing protein n=1 Tax=Sulfurimonas sediminis TaxID=2590020 RepID=A0A7M1B303_9BACT|nr:hypothetical protein [Sulfurimonas sediminis]QOP44035.1 hypothetical protein FJR45_08800 [Sulfurimonas sediminis]
MEKFELREINETIDKKTLYPYIDATEFNDKIKKAIKRMLGVVIPSGDNDINLDFDDVKIIMRHGGMGFSGVGEHDGENSAVEALKKAIVDSSLDYNFMNQVSGILIHFELHPDLPIINIAEAMDIIHKNTNNEADIAWGTTTDRSISKNYVKVTILFTGFEKNKLKHMAVNNIY